MKKEVIRLILNELFCTIAMILAEHYYDRGLITIGGVYRVLAICIIHMIYIGITSVKRYVAIEKAQEKA